MGSPAQVSSGPGYLCTSCFLFKSNGGGQENFWGQMIHKFTLHVALSRYRDASNKFRYEKHWVHTVLSKIRKSTRELSALTARAPVRSQWFLSASTVAVVVVVLKEQGKSTSRWVKGSMRQSFVCGERALHDE
jgi:hypothetical protein